MPVYCRFTVAALILLAAAAPLPGAEGESAGGTYDRWIDYYRQTAGEYDIRLDGDPDRKLKLRPEPLHVYHHPDGAGLKEQLGSLFVWTREGRPEVLGAIWSYPHGSPTRRNIVHEFHSLSLSPLTAVRKQQTFWNPQTAGIELQPVPDAPEPARSKGLRLAQMRALARQFTGYNDFFGKELQLRMTAQPVYRYETDGTGDVLDGALFVFFMDWDPEIVLSIEARRERGELRWYYAAARFSDKALRLKHEDRQVWTGDVTPQVGDVCGGPDQPFMAVHGVDQHEIE